MAIGRQQAKKAQDYIPTQIWKTDKHKEQSEEDKMKLTTQFQSEFDMKATEGWKREREGWKRDR